MNRRLCPFARIALMSSMRLGEVTGLPNLLPCARARAQACVLAFDVHEHLVQAGQAAEFDAMTPHRMAGPGGPAEVLTIFDRHGERAHLRPA